MIRVFQTKFADPRTGTGGNAFSACIASLLQIPLRTLPKTEGMDKERAFCALNDLLLDYGMLLECNDSRPKRAYCIETGFTAEHVVHSLITFNRAVVHDPHPEGQQLLHVKDLWTVRTIDEAYHGMKP